jgi:hypothetical protein
MNEVPTSRDNHYVPCVYLKSFAGKGGRVETYRTLVSHPSVPLWRPQSMRGIAYYSHLYTRVTAHGETNEIEKWLSRDFETPAEDALQKVTSDAQLTPVDWNNLVRFLAAQDVRTPARFLENVVRWNTQIPGLLQEVVEDSANHLKEMKAGTGMARPNTSRGDYDYIPFRVTAKIDPGSEFGTLKSEVLIGRPLWLFSLKYALTNTINALHQHRWTILTPPAGLRWFTSDDPVIKLNFYGDGKYDFNGGWGNRGTEIILPLSPRHLLYTMVGERPPRRGEMMARAHAEMVRRFIAEHAHRMIFAKSPDAEVVDLRPRMVNRDLFQAETEQRAEWHREQSTAERRLRGWSENTKSQAE